MMVQCYLDYMVPFATDMRKDWLKEEEGGYE